MSPLDLSGRRAVVTGAASGIGEACARRLAAAGADVVVVDLNADGARALAEEVGGTALPLDLGDMAAVDAACAPGGLIAGADVLVNNAGLQHVSPVDEFPVDRFALILRVMLEAPFRLTRAALPHMYGQGWGRFVHISSVHGLRASPNKSAYVTAKHGLEGFSKTLALEAGGRGVTSTTVCPGYVRTALVQGQIADQARTRGIPEADVVEKVMLADSVIKRMLEPEEVAEAVAYLCSDAASYSNGTALVLDGGWTAH